MRKVDVKNFLLGGIHIYLHMLLPYLDVIFILIKEISPTRRNVGKRLIVPRSFKPIVRSSFYRAIQRWNMLKAEYTLIDNLNSFKIAIKNNYDTCFM